MSTSQGKPGLLRVGIKGVGSCVPDRIMTNEDMEKIVDTSDEWIQQRTGIKARRVLADGQNTSDIATEAARRALESAGVDAADLDLIIMGTVSGDHIFPATACLVQDRLGAKKAGAFDVSGACTGFLMALSTAAQYVATGQCKKVLAIGAEGLSRIVDYKDRATCVIFGDGAGAAVITPYEDAQQGEILHTTLGADGSQFELIWMPAGGTKKPISQEVIDEGEHFIRIRGREVFRFAVTKMVELIKLEMSQLPEEKVGLIIPHQVNARIVEAAAERLDMPMDMIYMNIDKYGNTSAASVPVALDEAIKQGRMPKDQLTVLVAFGAGVAWGSALIRW